MDLTARALRLVSRDLRRVGLYVSSTGPNLKPTITRKRVLATKEEIRDSMQPHRLAVIRRRLKYISQIEAWAMKHFADGSEIRVDQIRPVAVECSSRLDLALFRYCRHYSSFPYTRLVGRQIRFFIRDAGHPAHPLMAIAALSSPVIQIRCRDRWIGWYGREFNAIRNDRLRCVMDLSVAIALPPYNHLLAGKLICYTAVSNKIRGWFREKYSDRGGGVLALITASSIFGKHTSQYNRVTFRDRTLFQFVGETQGFGTVHIAPDTFRALRDLLDANGKALGYELEDGFNWKLRVIRDGFRLLGLDPDVAMRHGLKRGIFVAPVATNTRQYLRGQTDEITHVDWPLEDLVDHWRTRWLAMRIGNSKIMRRVRSHDKRALRLSLAVAADGKGKTTGNAGASP